MSTLILAFVFMLILVSAMSIGVIMGRKPISGSCGGMKALGMDVECEVCHGDEDLCRKENQLTAHVRKKIADLSRPAK